MEIRLLQQEELATASGLAKYVFDTCVRERMEFEETASYIDAYLSLEEMERRVQEEVLLVWGGFENDQMVAVSAMEQNGLITMLYVHPQKQRKGYGNLLLRTMRTFARENLQLDKVVVNVAPVWRATYFYDREFSYIQKQKNMHVPYISMVAPTVCKELQMKKKVPFWVIIIIGLLILIVPTVLCVVSALIYGLQF